MSAGINGRLLIAGMAVLAFAASPAWAFRANPPVGRTGSPGSGNATCMSCHGTNVGTGMVEILNAPTQYQADVIYDLIVRVSDAARVGAGFQLSVEQANGTPAGTLIVTDAVNTQLNPDDNVFINHTSAGVSNSVTNWAANGNSASFNVRWQAPSTDVGAVTFWAAGNGINNNFSSTGDFIYLSNTSASFLAVPAVSEWGLLVLGLCVLTAGTLSLRRRSMTPVRV